MLSSELRPTSLDRISIARKFDNQIQIKILFSRVWLFCFTGGSYLMTFPWFHRSNLYRIDLFSRQYFDYVSKVLLPETLVMLYMKVVGKTQDEVCCNYRYLRS